MTRGQILPQLAGGGGPSRSDGGGAWDAERFRQVSPSTSFAGPPPRDELGEEFCVAAARLAGLAGALLGWRAEEFWRATPAELGAVIAALAGDGGDATTPPDTDTINRLREAFPDG